MTGPFTPAIEEMRSSGQKVFGPLSWKNDYLPKYLPDRSPKERERLSTTARYLSIQSLSDLNPDLRNNNTMIFRLGKGTFALLEVSVIEDFFLIDKDLDCKKEDFKPKVDTSELEHFFLMGYGSDSETNFVNLSIASGLLQKSLNLDTTDPRISPATGKSTYTFDFYPHHDFKEINFQHYEGQVEVDALYRGVRDGRKTIFVIEAKKGAPTQNSSLAKYKLAYPYLALTKTFPNDYDIIPVYFRAWAEKEKDEIHFLISECTFDRTDNDQLYVSKLSSRSTQHLVMTSPR